MFLLRHMVPLRKNEKSKVVNFRFAESDLERIDRVAQMVGLTRSEFIRLIYEDAIAEFEDDTETETQAVSKITDSRKNTDSQLSRTENAM